MTTAADIEILARTIYGEARGEPDLGRVAVGWTVRNRAQRYGSTLSEACLKSVHYSCWNNAAGNDANQLAMLTADLGNRSFARCMIAACQVAFGLAVDPTDGATHYHSRDIPPPAWALDDEGNQRPYHSIGRHLFYRGIA